MSWDERQFLERRRVDFARRGRKRTSGVCESSRKLPLSKVSIIGESELVVVAERRRKKGSGELRGFRRLKDAKGLRNSLPSRIDPSSNQIPHSIRPPVSTLDTGHIDPASEPVLVPETAPNLRRRMTSGDGIREESADSFELRERGVYIGDVWLDVCTDLKEGRRRSQWRIGGEKGEETRRVKVSHLHSSLVVEPHETFEVGVSGVVPREYFPEPIDLSSRKRERVIEESESVASRGHRV